MARIFLFLWLLSWHVNSANLSVSYHNFPPFSFQHGGQAQGIMVELVSEVCKQAKLSCEFQYFPNRRAKNYMAAGIVHGNIPLGWNATRAETLWFSVPLLQTEYGFYSKTSNNKTFRNIADLTGLKVGVFGPSNTQVALEKLQTSMHVHGLYPIEIEVMPNANEQGLEKLIRDRYDLYFVNRHVGQYLITTFNIEGVEYIGTSSQVDYHVGFAKAHVDPQLVRRFNQAILNMYANQGFDAIYQKWQLAPGKHTPDHLLQRDILH
ncbi:substrate-binding periplasmic protein [Motilimonas eburnea]|uniref:substrate-binding periplasmic protein n=1 Tax=Motilimonas eburnea TaxID=1737488 RepID=UPI001E6176DE|nr:transporter substrate-binding domain-containing protein [Motilimonas eburnea]MCE2571959.1 transporter substrate-binding domain-containing protein [Motilimonas eburnea]